MATLTGTTIKDTYKSLIKVNDNEELAATLQELTDGLGNGSGISINTSGDLKASGILEFGSLKDTGEDITIVKFVDQADGIGSNNNDTTIPTSAAVKDYVDTNVTAQDLDFTGNTGTGAVDLDSQTLNLIGANGVVTTASGQTITIDTSSLDTRLTTAEADIDTNTANIATEISDRTSADSTLQSNIDAEAATRLANDNTLQGNIDTEASTRSSADTTLQANIDTNTANISSNDTDIAGLDTRLTTAEGNITSNDTDIATNASNISTNTSNISTNTSNIATNVTDIATNATNISSNDTDITALQNDKYDKTGGTISGSVTISDDLTVNGTTTTVNTETLSVEDPLIEMANQNAANSVDTGFYAKYSLDAGVTTKYAGLFKDASDSDTFKLFKGLEVEPTTTINTGGTGYALADLDVAGLSASSGTITGDLIVDTDTLYVDSANNRVGIGSSSPVSKLTLEGARNTNTLTLRTIDNDSGWTIGDEFGAIEFYSNDTSGGSVGVMSAISCFTGTTSGSTSELSFSTSEFGSRNIERMRIKAGGDISFRDTSTNEAFYWDASTASLGIGTDSPSSKLSIENAVAGSSSLSLKHPAGSRFDFQTGITNVTTDALSIKDVGNSYDYLTLINGNVGIGTDSPQVELDIASAAPQIRLTDTDGGYCDVTNASGHLLLQADKGNTQPSSYMRFDVDATERMRITSGGDISFRDTSNNQAFYWDASTESLGIGTTSPADELHVYGNVDGTISTKVQNDFAGTNATAEIWAIAKGNNFRIVNYPDADTVNANRTDFISSAGGSYFTFSTASTERLRIDSSGYVGINETNPTNRLTVSQNYTYETSTTVHNNAHIKLQEDTASTYITNINGITYLSTAPQKGADRGALIDGNTKSATIKVAGRSEGTIQFKTSSGTTGTIISETERMRITNEGYIRLASASLGIQFGGDTAAANALNDYEEGTFTPVLADAATGGNTASPSDANGSYVKVGSMVTISIQLQNTDLTGMTGTNNAYIRNLPFSAKNLTGAIKFNATPRINLFSANANNMHTTVELGDNTNYIYFQESLTNSANALIATVSQFADGSDIFFTMTYFAD